MDKFVLSLTIMY